MRTSVTFGKGIYNGRDEALQQALQATQKTFAALESNVWLRHCIFTKGEDDSFRYVWQDAADNVLAEATLPAGTRASDVVDTALAAGLNLIKTYINLFAGQLQNRQSLTQSLQTLEQLSLRRAMTNQ